MSLRIPIQVHLQRLPYGIVDEPLQLLFGVFTFCLFSLQLRLEPLLLLDKSFILCDELSLHLLSLDQAVVLHNLGFSLFRLDFKREGLFELTIREILLTRVLLEDCQTRMTVN